ncbi:MAG: GNAT family N-acetyltransferase [Clostridia bacterium]|nr:GNAT family N-acetyltransferase [Clostridia bacterium]
MKTCGELSAASGRGVDGANVRMAYLCDHLHFAEEIAMWVYREFIEGIKDGVAYEQVLASMRNCRRDALPVRFVAIADGKCVGSVSLVDNDLRRRDDSPWLAALYVDEPYRKMKIGARLVECAQEAARELGYKALFLRTEHASGYYRKLGWRFVGTFDDDYSLKPDVFRFDLYGED